MHKMHFKSNPEKALKGLSRSESLRPTCLWKKVAIITRPLGTYINDVVFFKGFLNPPSTLIRFCPISAHAPITWCPFSTPPPPSNLICLFLPICMTNTQFHNLFWSSILILMQLHFQKIFLKESSCKSMKNLMERQIMLDWSGKF